MRWMLERVSEPAQEPLTVEQMKRQIRGYASNTAEDPDLEDIIQAARQWVENETSRALVDQQWRLSIGDQVAVDSVAQPVLCGYFAMTRQSEIYLRRSPVLAIVSFTSVDAAGIETDIDAANYELRDADSKFPRIVGLNGATWTTGLYRIIFRAGYMDLDSSPAGTVDDIPKNLLYAVRLYGQGLYDQDQELMATAAGLASYERCNLDFA